MVAVSNGCYPRAIAAGVLSYDGLSVVCALGAGFDRTALAGRARSRRGQYSWGCPHVVGRTDVSLKTAKAGENCNRAARQGTDYRLTKASRGHAT